MDKRGYEGESEFNRRRSLVGVEMCHSSVRNVQNVTLFLRGQNIGNKIVIYKSGKVHSINYYLPEL